MGGQPHAPTASTSGKYPVPVVQEAGWAPGPVWTGGEPRPHRDSNPDRPARSQSLYRLSYPAHYRPVLTLQNSMVIIFTIKFNAKYFSCRQQSKSIERSPSLEANTSSASQETPAFYGAETVFTAICPYPEPAQSNPCPHPTSWRLILITPSSLHLGLPSGLFPWGLPTKTLHASLPNPVPYHLPRPFHSSLFITRIIFGKEYRSWCFLLFSLLRYSVASSLLGPSILVSTQLSNTLSLRFSLNVSDQVSHPYKKTAKIRVLYILIFKFWIQSGRKWLHLW